MPLNTRAGGVMHIRPGIDLANLTDPGCVRERNEDYYAYAEPDSDDEFHRKGRLMVVADGMGGHAGGERASGIAVDVVRRLYFSPDSPDPLAALENAFREAHLQIRSFAEQHPQLEGMGTTCTAAAICDHRLYFGHVGDSRLYLIRNSTLSQLTTDHSYVARLISQGLLSPAEAAVHPDRNVLTAALGMSGSIPIDLSDPPVALEDNDLLLACTDGLHGLVTDNELLSVAADNTPSCACHLLVGMARARGGFDNITLQILRVIS